MRRALLGLLGWLFALGCGGGTPAEGDESGGGGGDTTEIVLNLQYDVVDQGGSLRLFWNELEDAIEYRVYSSERGLIATVESTAYTVTEENACSQLEVEAVLPDTSVRASLNIAGEVVVTSVSYWGDRDSDYNPAVGFTSGGEAVLYPLNEAYYEKFDVIADDGYPGEVRLDELALWSPDELGFNSKANGFAPWPSGSVVAPSPGNYYSVYPPSGAIQEDSSYAIWLDPGADGWDPSDHFVKAGISSIRDDGQIFAYFYYQTIGGLRWLPKE